MTEGQNTTRKAGQRIALVIAVTGVAWVLANMLGAHFGWTTRTRALFDLIALAGFGWAILVAISLWRSRQDK